MPDPKKRRRVRGKQAEVSTQPLGIVPAPEASEQAIVPEVSEQANRRLRGKQAIVPKGYEVAIVPYVPPRVSRWKAMTTEQRETRNAGRRGTRTQETQNSKAKFVGMNVRKLEWQVTKANRAARASELATVGQEAQAAAVQVIRAEAHRAMREQVLQDTQVAQDVIAARKFDEGRQQGSAEVMAACDSRIENAIDTITKQEEDKRKQVQATSWQDARDNVRKIADREGYQEGNLDAYVEYVMDKTCGKSQFEKHARGEARKWRNV